MSSDSDDILLPAIKDVPFKPACGEILDNGDVMVSGMQFQRQQIRTAGKSYKKLADIFLEVASEEASTTKE